MLNNLGRLGNQISMAFGLTKTVSLDANVRIQTAWVISRFSLGQVLKVRVCPAIVPTAA